MKVVQQIRTTSSNYSYAACYFTINSVFAPPFKKTCNSSRLPRKGFKHFSAYDLQPNSRCICMFIMQEKNQPSDANPKPSALQTRNISYDQKLDYVVKSMNLL